METTTNNAYNAGNLAQAAQRLDLALESLETRMRSMRTRTFAPFVDNADLDKQSLLIEIEEIRKREKDLEAAANAAFDLLGVAAANIRQLLDAEAA